MVPDITPVRWLRTDSETRERLVHRPSRHADETIIQQFDELADHSPDSPDRPRISAESPARNIRVVECDEQIVGWLTESCQRRPKDLPLEPWGQTNPEVLTGGTHASGASPEACALRVHQFGWFQRSLVRDVLTNEIPIELCQLYGYAEALHVTASRTWSEYASALSAAAFVQQLHSGPIDDPVITPMLEGPWRLDGWFPDESGTPRLLLRWINPVHR